MFKSIKKYLLLFVVVAALVCSVALTACGDNKEQTWHTHDYTYVSEGADGHHEECKEDGTRKLTEPHSYGSDNKCTKCGYEHVHDYEYVSDGEAGHHQECKDGDDKKETVAHNFGENDVCSDCGYKKPAAGHEHEYEFVSDGEAGHHEECKDGDDKKATVPHNYGEDDVCSDCGYKKPAAGHEHDYKYVSDGAAGHHQECKDGDDKKATVPHNFGENDVCSDCGYKKPAAGHEHDYEYVSDGELGHHKECKDGDDVTDIVPHSFVGDGICDYCGYVNPSAGGHVHDYKYVSDGEAGHHQECSAGDSKTPTVPHNFGSDNICDDCGYETSTLPNSTSWTVTVVNKEASYEKGTGLTVDYVNKDGGTTSANADDFKFDGNTASVTLTLTDLKAGQTVTVTVTGYTGSTNNDVGLKYTATNAKATSDCPDKVIFDSTTTKNAQGTGTFTFTVNADGTVTIQLLRSEGNTTRLSKIEITVGDGSGLPPVVDPGENDKREIISADNHPDVANLQKNTITGTLITVGDASKSSPATECGAGPAVADDDSKLTFTYGWFPSGSSSTYTVTALKDTTITVYYTISDSGYSSKLAEKDGILQWTINGGASVSSANTVKKASNVAYAETITLKEGDVCILTSSANRLILFAVAAAEAEGGDTPVEPELEVLKVGEELTTTLAGDKDTKTLEKHFKLEGITAGEYKFEMLNPSNAMAGYTEFTITAGSASGKMGDSWEGVLNALTLNFEEGCAELVITAKTTMSFDVTLLLTKVEKEPELPTLELGVPAEFTIPASGKSVTLPLGKSFKWDGRYVLTIESDDLEFYNVTITVTNMFELGTIVNGWGEIVIDMFNELSAGIMFEQSGNTAILVTVTISEASADYVLEADNSELTVEAEGYTEVQISFGDSVEDGKEYTLDISLGENVTIMVAYGDDYWNDYTEIALTEWVHSYFTFTANKSFGLSINVQGSGNYFVFLKLKPAETSGEDADPAEGPVEGKYASVTLTYADLESNHFSLDNPVLYTITSDPSYSDVNYTITFNGGELVVIYYPWGYALREMGGATVIKDGDTIEFAPLFNSDLYVYAPAGSYIDFSLAGNGSGGATDGTKDVPREAAYGENVAETGKELYYSFFNEGEAKTFVIEFAETYSGVGLYLYGDDFEFDALTDSLFASDGGKLEVEVGYYGMIYFVLDTIGADVDVTFYITEKEDESEPTEYTVTINYGDGKSVTLSVTEEDTISLEDIVAAINDEAYTVDTVEVYTDEKHESAYDYEPVTSDVTLYVVLKTTGGEENATSWTVTVVSGEASYETGTGLTVDYVNAAGTSTSANADDFKFDGNTASVTLTLTDLKAGQTVTVIVTGYTGSTNNAAGLKYTATNAKATSDCPAKVIFDSTTTKAAQGTGTFTFTVSADGTVTIQLLRSEGNTTRLSKIEITVGDGSDLPPVEETDGVIYKVDDDGKETGTEIAANGTITDNDLFTITNTVKSKYQDLTANTKGLTFSFTNEDSYTPGYGIVTSTSYETQELFTVTAKQNVKVILYVQISDSTYKSDRAESSWTITVGGNSWNVANDQARTGIIKLVIDLKEGETATVTMNSNKSGSKYYPWLFAAEGIPAEGGDTPAVGYTVTFDYADGATENLVVNNVTGKVEEPTPAPERKGYNFLGWFNGEEETAWNFENEVTEDMTLTAKWERIEYTIYYRHGDTNGLIASQKTVGGKAVKRADPTRSSYKFLGWYTQATGGEVFDFETEIYEDTTIYAHWEEIVWNVTFVWNYEGAPEPETVQTVGGKVTQPENPRNDHFWRLNAWKKDDGTTFYLTSVVTQNMTLTAEWVYAYDLKVGEEAEIATSGNNATEKTIWLEVGTYTVIISGEYVSDFRIAESFEAFGGDSGTIIAAGTVTRAKIEVKVADKYTFKIVDMKWQSRSVMLVIVEGDQTQGTDPEPEVPDTVIVEGVEKEITPPQWTPVDYTFKAEKSGEYTITLVGISGGDYSVKVNDGDPIIDGDFSQTSGKFTAEAGKEYKLTFYTGVNRTFKVLITGETEPEVPDTVIVEGVEKEITTTPWVEKDYIFNAEAAGEYTITLEGISSGNYSIKVNGGEPIIDGSAPWMATTATFTAQAGENTLTFYFEVTKTITVTITKAEPDEPGNGDEDEVIKVETSFENGAVSADQNVFTVVDGNIKKDISVKVNGKTYTTGLKFESSTGTVKVTPDHDGIVYLYIDAAAKVKINGVATANKAEAYTANDSNCYVISFEVTAGEIYTITKGDTANLIYAIYEYVDKGGETEPEVPENVIVEGVEKEITPSQWIPEDYTFKAEKSGEYTITLVGISGGDYSVKVNDGDPIIDGDFGQTSGKFTAEAGKEYKLTFYTGVNRTFKVLITAESAGTTSVDVSVGEPAENVVLGTEETVLNLKGIVLESEYRITVSAQEVAKAAIEGLTIWAVLGEGNEKELTYDAYNDVYYVVITVSIDQISLRASKAINVTIKISAYEDEGFSDELNLDVLQTYTIQGGQFKRLYFNAPKAGMYKVTFSGIEAGQVIANDGEPHDGLEFTFKIRPDAEDTTRSIQIYNNTYDNLTVGVKVTKEVDLDGTDDKLHVDGTIDVSITSTEGISDTIEIELADLQEGEAYAIRVTSEFNLMRDWLEFEYDNTVITMNQKNPFATFYATSANIITVKAAKFMEQDELPVTFALTNALAYDGEPFEVVIEKDKDIVVPLVGIEEGKVYTIRLKAEAAIGRSNFVAHYNNEDIPLVDNGTGKFYVATFRAGTESDTDTDILVNYVTFTYDSVELDVLTIHVSLVEGDESQVVETPEVNLNMGENQITIPESGRIKLVLQVPEYGNYMISVDNAEGISITYAGREIGFDVPFEADYLTVMVLTGEANATLKITLKKAVSGLAPGTKISIMPEEIGMDADTAYEIALAIEEGKRYTITLDPGGMMDYNKLMSARIGFGSTFTQVGGTYSYTFTATSDNVVKIYAPTPLSFNLGFSYELAG